MVFFNDGFIAPLKGKPAGRILDFGTGSGVWLSLALTQIENWTAVGIDISPTSVNWARATLNAAKIENRAQILEGDALSYRPSSPAQAAISCFVLEHLEEPQRLLDAIAESLESGASAFVCAALTAAEIDHIYEFRKESELVLMAENSGFRVCRIQSSSSIKLTPPRRYLPRSMGMVLEKA